MRKLIVILAAIVVAIQVNAQAPCQNDPMYAGYPPGICNPGLPNAFSNQAFYHVYQLVTDTNLIYNQNSVSVIGERICDIVIPGIPTEWVAAGNYNDPNGYWLNGGTSFNRTSVQGCIIISINQGTLLNALGGNDSITLPIQIYIDAWVIGNPTPSMPTWLSTIGPPPCGASIVYYDTLKVYRLTGLDEGKGNAGFIVDGNYPNPFSGSTQINYTTLKEEPIAFTVYDVVGKMVYQQNYHSNTGTNSITFNAEGLSFGMYTYTLSNGMYAYTRKLLIQQ